MLSTTIQHESTNAPGMRVRELTVKFRTWTSRFSYLVQWRMSSCLQTPPKGVLLKFVAANVLPQRPLPLKTTRGNFARPALFILWARPFLVLPASTRSAPPSPILSVICFSLFAVLQPLHSEGLIRGKRGAAVVFVRIEAGR